MINTHAVLVDDDSKIVIQVSLNKPASAQIPIADAKWLDVAAAPIAGQIMQEDGSFEDPLPPRNIEAEVVAHAVALKVGVVNATNKAGTVYPVSAQAIAEITEKFSQTAAAINTKAAKANAGRGDAVTEDEWETLDLIEAGFVFFTAVDAAAQTILAAGDAADPIASDTRWPAIPIAE